MALCNRMLLLWFALATQANGDGHSMVEMEHTYMNENDEELTGYLIYEDMPGMDMRPGLLIFDGPWGDGGGPSARDYAREYARKGMVVFLPDYLPSDNNPETEAIAGALSVNFLGNTSHAQDTANRGYQQLVGLSMVDPDRIGAIGFCFGGSMVLNLARTGAALTVAVSLHGEYPTRGNAEDESWNTKFFIEMVGALDPMISGEARDSWVAELSEHTAGTDDTWDLVIYGNTYHGFSMQYTQMFMQTFATLMGVPLTEMDVDGTTVYGVQGMFQYSPMRQKETFDRIDDLFEEHMLIGEPMTTCGSVKDYYRDNGCCGMPDKMIPMMMDDHTRG